MQDEFTLTGYPWVDLALIAAALAIVATIVHRAVTFVSGRFASHHPVAARLFECTNLPATWVLWLASFNLVLESAPATLRGYGTARQALAVALVAALTWLGVRLARAVTDIVIELHPSTAVDNIEARRLQTQARVLGRTLSVLVVIIGVALVLMSFPGVRQIGTSLLASAGLAGLVAGLAARPVLSNLIAGMQIAFTQPMRIDDVLIVENEWGRVEEIRGSYVVLRLWDERRLVIPLQWFIEHPFQNWTRSSSQIMGTTFVWVDFHTRLDPLRKEVDRLCKADPAWDGRVAILQVTDTNEHAMQLRVLVSSADSGKNFDLRCRVREGLIDFLQREQPDALPRLRANVRALPERNALESAPLRRQAGGL
ncbi:MAG TPA: mechanosensitive ion channel domain-containing protein [Casimicrobiaceae bacterium]|nr:mechanosensitive ion channel domain-containing protein [Casimicrobiaceae bacterium]